jgi:hypothetical protein
MAIAFRGRRGLSALDGGNITLNPSSVGSGSPASVDDICLVIASSFNRAGNETRIGNALGYTQVADFTSGTQRFRVAYKIYAAGENTVTVEGSANAADGMSAQLMIFSGIDTASPLSTTTITATGASTNPNPPSITPAHNDCLIIAMCGSNNTDVSPGTIANYDTTAIGAAANDTNDSVTHCAYRILTGNSGVAQDPAAWSSWSTGSWGCATLAIKPLIHTLMGQAVL